MTCPVATFQAANSAVVPLTGVVVRGTFGTARFQRQPRWRAVRRLDLTLLVEAQDEGVVGRTQGEADDVPHRVDEQRIGRQLERFGALRLQSEGPPDPRDRRLAQARGLGHPARASRRGVRRLRFQGLGHHALRVGLADRPRRSRPRLVEQAVQATLDEPRPALQRQ